MADMLLKAAHIIAYTLALASVIAAIASFIWVFMFVGEFIAGPYGALVGGIASVCALIGAGNYLVSGRVW